MDICINCKNKEVCKWCNDKENIIKFNEQRSKDSPIKIELKCLKRRVK